MLNFIVNGRERIKRIFDNFGNLPEAQEKAAEKAVLFVHSEMPPYPNPPPDSNYRRTGTLGRTITTIQGSGGAPEALSRVESGMFGVKGIVGTALSYGPYVIGKEDQAEVHRGRWYILEDVIDGLRGDIMKIYRAMVKALMKP
jgi:hypothetical protein